MGSRFEDDSVVAGDYEDQSNGSTYKGLFLNIQVVYRLMEEWSVYLYHCN